MMVRTAIFSIFLLSALTSVFVWADVVEDSENRVLKSLKVVVTAVDVTEEAAKLGLSSEVISKEVSKVLKSSKIEESRPEKGKARPVFIVKLYLGTEYKKGGDINDVAPDPKEDEAKENETKADVSAAAESKAVSGKSGASVKESKSQKETKPVKSEDHLAGFLQVRIADLAKIERLGDQPVSVNSFERIYPFQARPRSKVKQAVIEVLIGKTFKRDFRGAVKAARASGVP